MKESDILDLAIEAFCTELGVMGKSFGSSSTGYRGISDGKEGVQWNIWKNKDSEKIWLGVNLEGMKYDNWPIADFIGNELWETALIKIARKIKEPSKIIVGLHRDAWQITSRPPIKESIIGGDRELPLIDLTKIRWKNMLTEALCCLDKEKNYRGRAWQKVILLKSGKVKEMQVSPHLNIHTQIGENKSVSNVKILIKNSFDRLRPIYTFVNASVSTRAEFNSSG